MKIFQRALQYCDPKKVHLALLGMYQRTEQHKLASELLDKMARKFKRSCKVQHFTFSFSMSLHFGLLVMWLIMYFLAFSGLAESHSISFETKL